MPAAHKRRTRDLSVTSRASAALLVCKISIIPSKILIFGHLCGTPAFAVEDIPE